MSLIIPVLEKQKAAKQRDNVNQTPINVLIVEDEKRSAALSGLRLRVRAGEF